jgi:hypothetical protein
MVIKGRIQKMNLRIKRMDHLRQLPVLDEETEKYVM